MESFEKKIMTMIKSSYSSAKSEQLKVKSGVIQGCILSPVLFLLVINDFLVAALNPLVSCGLRWRMSNLASLANLKHVEYSDDICLLAEKICDVARMSDALNVHVLKAELNINIGKTKLLSFPARDRLISIRREQMDNINSFT